MNVTGNISYVNSHVIAISKSTRMYMTIAININVNYSESIIHKVKMLKYEVPSKLWNLIEFFYNSLFSAKSWQNPAEMCLR